jgi:hypothetical protein
MRFTRRPRRATAALAALLAAGVAVWWWASQTRLVPVPVATRFELAATPLGDAAYDAESLAADVTATLAPGRYAFDTDSGRWTVTVPPGGVARGHLAARVRERGEEDGRRWIAVEIDPSRLVFDPPVRVTDPHGLEANLSGVSAGGGEVAAAVNPLVAQSLAGLVAARVRSRPAADGVASPDQLVRAVRVSSGVVTLREGGQLGWADGGAASRFVIRSGSELRVRDLTITGRGEVAGGQLSATLRIGPGSEVRAGGAEVRVADGELRADFDLGRTSDGVRVDLVPGTEGVLTLDRARVTFAGVAGEVAADHLRATLHRLSWEEHPGTAPAAVVRSRVEATGITVPGQEVGGRVDAVTATVAGDAAEVELNEVRVRVPGRRLLAVAAAAVPGVVKLDDLPIVEEVAGAFRQVRLAGLRVEPGRPDLDFAGDGVAFASRPVVRGRLAALGRRDEVVLRPRDVQGPLGLRVTVGVPTHEVTWDSELDLPFAVPLTLRGRAAADLLPGANLTEAQVRVRTACDAVTIGEQPIAGLPMVLAPVVRLAERLRDNARIDGVALPEYLRRFATHEETLPLFGPELPAETRALLRRVVVRSPVVTQSNGDVLITGAATLRGP